MRIFGLEITRAKAKAMSAVSGDRGWFSILNSFTGAWQQAVEVDPPKSVLAFSAVFACVTGIAGDIAKLRLRIVEESADGILKEIPRTAPQAAVLRRPNHFQTLYQFIVCWVISKLIWGNTYALKRRDARGIVVALYLLDPQRVTPLVTESGDIYYRLAADNLAGFPDGITVPANEIIHDIMWPLFHPLVGVSPIYACGMSATMGNKIQGNSATFFANMSAPSGMLTAPEKITDETATRLKNTFEHGFSGKNVGRIFVAGEGLEFKGLAMPADDAQLIEQLKWTVEDVARAFHYPLYKLGGTVPNGASIESLNQGYYSECLQTLIEPMEAVLDHGLGIAAPRYVEADLEGLLRMDQGAQAEMEMNLVKGGIKSPNESRAARNLPPAKGGESPFMQQQMWSLEQLSNRKAPSDAADAVVPPAPPGAANDDQAAEEIARMFAKIEANIAALAKSPPEATPDLAEDDGAALAAAFIDGLKGAAIAGDGLAPSAALHAAAMIQEDAERLAAEGAARLDRIEAGQAEIVGALRGVSATSERVIETLMLPVEPVYDSRGKLARAQRKPKED